MSYAGTERMRMADEDNKRKEINIAADRSDDLDLVIICNESQA